MNTNPSRAPFTLLPLVLLFLVTLGVLAWILFVDDTEPAADQDRSATIEEVGEAAGAASPDTQQPVRILSGPEVPTEMIAPLPPAIAERVRARQQGDVLHGSVVDAITGEPVTRFAIFCAPAKTNLRTFASEARNARIFPNALGTFTFYGLEHGRYNLLLRRAEYEELIVTDVVVPQGTEPLVLHMSPGAFVDGRVYGSEGPDPDGDGGLGGIEVRLVPIAIDDPSKAPGVMLKFTTADGRFRFSNLPSGTYSVRLASDSLGVPAHEQFYVAPGRRYPVTFTLPDQNSVTFQVTDVDQVALNMVHMKLWPSKSGTGLFAGVTDNDGRLTLEHVPAGEYTLKAYKAGYLRKLQDLVLTSSSGEHSFDIVLQVSPHDELNPTREQLERLKRGERPEDVFGDPNDPRRHNQGNEDG